ncbi:MAG: type II secretion system protein [Verrucomicrobiota bacterium]
MKPRNLDPSAETTKALSLVEMLVVVSIMGILTAIVVVPYTKVTRERTDQARNRVNAQQIVSMAQSAQAGGVSLVVPGDLDATLTLVIAGGTAPEGVFTGATFSLEGMDAESVEKAKTYLELDGSSLIYNPKY